jgi:hypothetical protein
MKFQVLDTDLPADCYHHEVGDSWDQSSFDSMEDAREYAINWLGPYKSVIRDDWQGESIRYSAFSRIEIRKVENDLFIQGFQGVR